MMLLIRETGKDVLMYYHEFLKIYLLRIFPLSRAPISHSCLNIKSLPYIYTGKDIFMYYEVFFLLIYLEYFLYLEHHSVIVV